MASSSPQCHPLHVIYEVNIAADADIAGDYEQWLFTKDGHADEMLQQPGFLRWEWERALPLPCSDPDLAPTDGKVRFCVRYTLENLDAMKRYLAEGAAKARSGGAERFKSKASYERRVIFPQASSGSAKV